MEHKVAQQFLDTINSIIDDKLSSIDRVEVCQIVSNDDGSGLYNIKLLSDDGTIIRNVLNCTDFSFSNGDYVYILKVKNKLSNSFIIGGNAPKITNAELNKPISIMASDINSSEAISGQVLTADGNGNTSWQTPQSGGGGGSGNVDDIVYNGSSIVTNHIANLNEPLSNYYLASNPNNYITSSYHDSTKEDISNKVTSISSSSTNTQYPSAKCVYDNIENVREVAEGKKQTYVVSDVSNPSFNSQNDTISITGNIIDINGNIVPTEDLEVGDTVYVTQTDVPDRWVSNKLSLNVVQIMNNGNFVSTTGWTSSSSVLSVNDNIAICTIATPNNNVFQLHQKPSYIAGHKYLITAQAKLSNTGPSSGRPALCIRIYDTGTPTISVINPVADTWYDISGIITATRSANIETNCNFLYGSSLQTGDTMQVKNFMVIDLTTMYGEGAEPTTVTEFRADYPNEYYEYNTSSSGYVSLSLSILETVKPLIESISVNGTNIQPVLGNVDITVPAKTSDLINDSFVSDVIVDGISTVTNHTATILTENGITSSSNSGGGTILSLSLSSTSSIAPKNMSLSQQQNVNIFLEQNGTVIKTTINDLDYNKIKVVDNEQAGLTLINENDFLFVKNN